MDYEARDYDPSAPTSTTKVATCGNFRAEVRACGGRLIRVFWIGTGRQPLTIFRGGLSGYPDRVLGAKGAAAGSKCARLQTRQRVPT